MGTTFGLRWLFSDGTTALDGKIGVSTPTILDADMAEDIQRGWALGVGAKLQDGRVVTGCSVEPNVVLTEAVGT